MNNRRKLVIAFGAGALAAPFGSFAQQQNKVWRVGFLALRQVVISESDAYYGPFRQGMRELGYVDGKNLVIEWRSAEGNSARLPGLAAELVQLKVDVIVVAGTSATGAAKKATTTMPIVMASVNDPVGSGFIASLARPGGNITGATNLGVDVIPKHLEMLLNMAPRLSRIAVLVNPANAGNSPMLEILQPAAQKVRVKLLPMEAQSPEEIEKAFSEMSRQKAGAVILARDPFLNQQVRQIADLAAKHRLPTIAGVRNYVEAGGLMSYGASVRDQYRRAATYVDKILKGAKPSDLPVEQPTKFELFINGKTVKTLGLKIPYALQIMVDEVIE
jgi:putative ABC transport system substrate-binding protein